MNNLRLYGGRVPLLTGDADHPVKLVDFPTREVFDSLYGNRVKGENRERYFAMLRSRANGSTLIEAGKPYGLTRERVRQIEAKFLRLMRQHHQKK
jgi:hypothetical protein